MSRNPLKPLKAVGRKLKAVLTRSKNKRSASGQPPIQRVPTVNAAFATHGGRPPNSSASVSRVATREAADEEAEASGGLEPPTETSRPVTPPQTISTPAIQSTAQYRQVKNGDPAIGEGSSTGGEGAPHGNDGTSPEHAEAA